jgi:S-adenosylmethionine decarboxylase
MHLIIEGRQGNPEMLESPHIVYDFLNRAVLVSQLNKITPPIVTEYCGENPDDWGISGIVMIAESHISIHTFPEYNEASIDIFTCREFDTENALDTIKEMFGFQEVEYIVINRGLEFREQRKMSIKDLDAIV